MTFSWPRETMTGVRLDDLLDDLYPEPEPHPALVAAIRPTPRQVTEAARELGWLPPGPYLRPAVPGQGEL